MTGKIFGENTNRLRDWFDLNDQIDNIAGGNIPCRQAPDLYFPEYGDGTAAQHASMAKKACGKCEVIEACANYALKHKEEFGIWGGMSYTDRKEIWRKNK